LTSKQTLVVSLSKSEVAELCASREEKLRALQDRSGVKLVLREQDSDNKLKIIGPPEAAEAARRMVEDVLSLMRKRGRLSKQEFRHAVRLAASDHIPDDASEEGNGAEPVPDGRRAMELMLEEIPVPLKRTRLSPLTQSQRAYLEAIDKHTFVFGVGPAGTGKTFLAMAKAVGALTEGRVSRIILCRPAVEAGERLGFLPGDLAQKFDPFIRPLWDALYEMMEGEKIRAAVESGVIEIAPLAYMRGRTLNNAFVILDEGQNTSIEQMKMFITRLGFDSQAVITGDMTQVDLPKGQQSGLVHAVRILNDIEGVKVVHFNDRDVVRHPLLTRIIQAYDKDKKESS
jgi:phosphate starvation-inducible PhoH-like protein